MALFPGLALGIPPRRGRRRRRWRGCSRARGLPLLRSFERRLTGRAWTTRRRADRRHRAARRERDRERAAARGGARAAPGVARDGAAFCVAAFGEVRRRSAARQRVRAAVVPRVAAVDLGTNSTRLLVADVVDGPCRRARAPDDGHPSRRGRRRAPAPPARGDRARARTSSRTTAASRRARRDACARGRDERRARRRRTARVPRRDRVELRLRDPSPERRRGGARSRGAASARSTTARCVVDVGGGSTELILGAFRTSASTSARRGSPSASCSTIRRDDDELAAAAAHVARRSPRSTCDAAVGVAGTVAQLEALAGRLGARRRSSSASSTTSRACRPRTGARFSRLEPARAPVIVGGAADRRARCFASTVSTGSTSASATCSTASRSRLRHCRSRTKYVAPSHLPAAECVRTQAT